MLKIMYHIGAKFYVHLIFYGAQVRNIVIIWYRHFCTSFCNFSKFFTVQKLTYHIGAQFYVQLFFMVLK